MFTRTHRLALALLVALAIMAGCTARGGPTAKPAANPKVALYSTTSFQASGIYDILAKAFEAKYPQYKLEPHFVGSGEALAAAQQGLADVVLAHSPKDEEALMATGLMAGRSAVMVNDFVIVGPKEDPAGIKGKSAVDAMKAIAAWGAGLPKGAAGFISRGQKSGTLSKELKLWGKAEIATPTPTSDSWYVSAGAGMGEVLQLAWQKKAYTLTDRGSWLNVRKALTGTVILNEGDKEYLNPYHVIVPDAARFPKVELNQAGGQAFADFLVSPEGQKLIADYKIEGEQVFTPDAGK